MQLFTLSFNAHSHNITTQKLTNDGGATGGNGGTYPPSSPRTDFLICPNSRGKCGGRETFGEISGPLLITAPLLLKRQPCINIIIIIIYYYYYLFIIIIIIIIIII